MKCRRFAAGLALGVGALGALAALASGAAETPSVKADRLPIIFAHGLGVPAVVYERVIPIQRIFRGLGYELLVARTPTVGSVDERARVLDDEIRRLVPDAGQRFHLLAHSMGGLDARLAIRRYRLGDRCASLTTLATPHRGSRLADIVLDRMDRAQTLTPWMRELLALVGDDIRALRDLSTRWVVDEFNPRVPNDPRVEYFSLAFYIPEPVERHSRVPLFWVSHPIVKDGGSSHNDGLVGVDSARWGTSLGLVAADHWSETAPIPFVGGRDYREILARVARNLDERFLE